MINEEDWPPMDSTYSPIYDGVEVGTGRQLFDGAILRTWWDGTVREVLQQCQHHHQKIHAAFWCAQQQWEGKFRPGLMEVKDE